MVIIVGIDIPPSLRPLKYLSYDLGIPEKKVLKTAELY